MAEPIEITEAQIRAALCDEIVDNLTCTAAHEDEEQTLAVEGDGGFSWAEADEAVRPLAIDVSEIARAAVERTERDICRAFGLAGIPMTRDNLTAARAEGQTLTLEYLRDMRRRHFAPAPRHVWIDGVDMPGTFVTDDAAQQWVTVANYQPRIGGTYYAMDLAASFKPPDPAERENALRLLETVVGAKKMARFKAIGRMKVHGASGAVYTLRESLMTAMRIKPPSPLRVGRGKRKRRPKNSGGSKFWPSKPIPVLRRAMTTRLCFELPGSFHPLDKMIAEILMIQTDEKRYLEIAIAQTPPREIRERMRPHPQEHRNYLWRDLVDVHERISP